MLGALTRSREPATLILIVDLGGFASQRRYGSDTSWNRSPGRFRFGLAAE